MLKNSPIILSGTSQIFYLLFFLTFVAADPLGKSDHIVMEYDYIYFVRVSESKNTKYLYERGDYQAFNDELLDIDLDHLFTDKSVKEMWADFEFHARYILLLNKYVPIKTCSEFNGVPQCMNK